MEVYVFAELCNEVPHPKTLRTFSSFEDLFDFCLESKKKTNKSILKHHVITAHGFVAYVSFVGKDVPARDITDVIISLVNKRINLFPEKEDEKLPIPKNILEPNSQDTTIPYEM